MRLVTGLSSNYSSRINKMLEIYLMNIEHANRYYAVLFATALSRIKRMRCRLLRLMIL